LHFVAFHHDVLLQLIFYTLLILISHGGSDGGLGAEEELGVSS